MTHFMRLFVLCRSILAQFFYRFNNTDIIATLTNPYGKRYTPISLPADGPITQILQPIFKALASPFWLPADFFVFFQQLVTYSCYLEEPLWHRDHEQRCVTSPALWIIMCDLFFCQEQAAFAQLVYYHLVR